MTATETFVVSKRPSDGMSELPADTRISSSAGVYQTYWKRRGANRADLWLSDEPDLFTDLKKGADEAGGSQHRLLIVGGRLSRSRMEFLRMWFRSVEYVDERDAERKQGEDVWLPRQELLEAVSVEHRDELVIHASADFEDEILILLRGNLERLAVPFDWFTRREAVSDLDFSRLRLTDYGQTLEIGDHGVDVEAIFWTFDEDVRRRMKKRQLELDDSFGGSLRRLRLQQGLSQADFAPVSERQIRRIETGETEDPRQETIAVIAERLGVAPDKIPSY